MMRESRSKPGRRLVRWFDWMPLDAEIKWSCRQIRFEKYRCPVAYINMQSPVVGVLENGFNCRALDGVECRCCALSCKFPQSLSDRCGQYATRMSDLNWQPELWLVNTFHLCTESSLENQICWPVRLHMPASRGLCRSNNLIPLLMHHLC